MKEYFVSNLLVTIFTETIENMDTKTFLQQVKIKAEAKAKQMNALELSIWNDRHEKELKESFGFNDKQIDERKKQLAATK